FTAGRRPPRRRPSKATEAELAAWPDLLHPLLRQHGVAVVEEAGLAALGYPPQWVNGGFELIRIRRKLGGNGHGTGRRTGPDRDHGGGSGTRVNRGPGLVPGRGERRL